MDSIKEVQARLGLMVKAMLAKGLRQPEATYDIRSDREPTVFIVHRPPHEPSGSYTHFNTFADAEEWISDLPSPEEAAHQEFMVQLAKTIELGKHHHIDVQFVNPLVEAMKRLSENAITFRPSP